MSAATLSAVRVWNTGGYKGTYRKVFAVVLDLKSEVLVRLQMMLVNVMLLLPLPFVLVVQHERVLVTELSVKTESQALLGTYDKWYSLESDVVMIMMMSHELN